MTFIEQFHFLRPWWLLGLIAAGLLIVGARRGAQQYGQWGKVIAPHLLPYLMETSAAGRRNYAIWFAAGISVCVLAMAGPTWQKVPLPVHKSERPLVVVFDLSPSMLVEDLIPNRLSRARLKVIDLLERRKEGTTALISYGGEAFVASPLTDDAQTISAMVPALHPNIIPTAGSSADKAIERALDLIRNAGDIDGDILLVTDGIDVDIRDNINQLLRDKIDIRLSILAVGTDEGGPIPAPGGGFARSQNGAIVMPRMDNEHLNQLESLTRRNGGLAVQIAPTDRDINQLSDLFDLESDSVKPLDERTTDTWHDRGYWLALLMIPVVLMIFRRGAIALVLLIPLATPEQALALSWEDLWRTPDQQGAKAFEKGDPETARERFRNPDWKASAAYRAGDFEAAAELFDDSTAIGAFNKGNALAKQGKFDDAVAAYDRAIELNPELDDAAVNKQIVETLRDNQQNSESSENAGQDNPSQNNQEGSEQSGQDSANQDTATQDNANQKKPADSPSEQKQEQQGEPRDGSQNQPSQAQSSDKSDSSDHSEQPEQAGQPNNQETEQNDENRSDQAQVGQGRDSELGEGNEGKALAAQETNELTDEEAQQMDLWLRKIPDDPGRLLREKFRYQSEQRAQEQRGFQLPSENTERW
ncbi:MAG: VWA domain-containing protein [bacterium]